MRVKIVSHTSYIAQTDDGDFPLRFQVDDEHDMVFGFKDKVAVVGYLTRDEYPQDPFVYMDGNGHIYTRRDAADDMQEALALDSDWEPDVFDIRQADETEALAIKSAIQYLLRETRTVGDNRTDPYTVVSVVAKGYNDQCEYEWEAVFTNSSGEQTERFVQGIDENGRDSVWTWDGEDGYPIEDLDDLALKLFKEQYEAGKLGNPYAVPLRIRGQDTSSPTQLSLYQSGQLDLDELPNNALGGAVWVPDNDTLEMINEQPEGERREYAIKQAKAAAELYEAWANNDVWDVCLQVYDQVNGQWVPRPEEDEDILCANVHGYDDAKEELQVEVDGRLKQL